MASITRVLDRCRHHIEDPGLDWSETRARVFGEVLDYYRSKGLVNNSTHTGSLRNEIAAIIERAKCENTSSGIEEIQFILEHPETVLGENLQQNGDKAMENTISTVKDAAKVAATTAAGKVILKQFSAAIVASLPKKYQPVAKALPKELLEIAAMFIIKVGADHLPISDPRIQKISECVVTAASVDAGVKMAEWFNSIIANIALPDIISAPATKQGTPAPTSE